MAAVTSAAAPAVIAPFETFNAAKKQVEFITRVSLSISGASMSSNATTSTTLATLTNLKSFCFHNVLGYEKDLSKYRSHGHLELRCAPGCNEKEEKKFKEIFSYLRDRKKAVKIELRDKDLVLYFDPPPGPVDEETAIKCYFTRIDGSQFRPPKLPSADSVAARHERLRLENGGVGFPSSKPDLASNPHGWFYPPHRVVLSHVLNDSTSEVIELGSWLGKSTRFICDRAPNALLYAVDIWSNEFSLSDDHYTNKAHTEVGVGKNRNQQVDTNFEILKNQPLYETFFVTNWDYRVGARPGCKGGIGESGARERGGGIRSVLTPGPTSSIAPRFRSLAWFSSPLPHDDPLWARDAEGCRRRPLCGVHRRRPPLRRRIQGRQVDA